MSPRNPQQNRQERTENKKDQQRQERSVETRKHRLLFSRLRSMFLRLVAIVGFFAAVITFLPRVSVIPGDPVETGDPFSASFTITPSNVFPLRNVGAMVSMIEFEARPRPFNEEKRPQITDIDKLGGFTRNEWNNHDLSMDEKFTISPYTTFVPANQFAVAAGADIAIVVEYQPWFIPIRRRQAFRFVTHRFADGSYRWYSYPLK
jgi:hypothetical protein